MNESNKREKDKLSKIVAKIIKRGEECQE